MKQFVLVSLVATAPLTFANTQTELAPPDLARLRELELTLERTAAESDRAIDDAAPILSRALASEQPETAVD